MSSLPLGFLAPWQPKHDSLRVGATSLMKLTAPLAAGAVAGALAVGGAAGRATLAGGATDRARTASAVATAAQRMQKQVRGRGMTNGTPEVNEAEPGGSPGWGGAAGGGKQQRPLYERPRACRGGKCPGVCAPIPGQVRPRGPSRWPRRWPMAMFLAIFPPRRNSFSLNQLGPR